MTINLATDSGGQWWAWVAVGLATLTVAFTTVAVDLRRTNQANVPHYGRARHNNPRTNVTMSGVSARSGSTVSQTVNINPPAIAIALTMTIVYGAAVATLYALGVLNVNSSRDQASANPDLPINGSPSPVTAEEVAPIPPSIEVDKQGHFCNDWVTQNSVEELNAALPISEELIAEGDWPDWAPVSDGVRAKASTVLLTVQGVNSTQVVINDIRAVVQSRRQPVDGLALTRECGGEGAYRLLEVDLDQNPPTATAVETGYTTPPPGEPEWSITPIRFPYEVSVEDAETFAITGYTEEFDVDWVIEVDWTSAGSSGTITADDDGQPFRTTSTSRARDCVIWDQIECFD
ncbi:hypothetical protein GCM10023328_02120 [Modestobacter marinus]|uniref:Uncharacterized protein n=2 Tax=Modestobacter marinus TaxID=477641 RepID=A0ABQ2FTY8_9ACTN|nr:hypothetical protein GCM10011589_07840 [Modestobacter marinus]